jgi:haloalkane dehalogenase
MEYLRTPANCFEAIPNYTFPENHHVIDAKSGMRMHYVDLKPDEKSKGIILMLHGEPSWSFLYREMINMAVAQGYRVVAPDLIGFGKSDKPIDPDCYTYANHLAWLRSLISALALEEINLLCQDWGGLLGLRLVAEQPDKYSSVVAANTFLPTGDQGANDAFKQWQHFSQTVPIFPVGDVLQKATVTELPRDVINAYNAPFPTEKHKAGVRKFPLLVPISSDNPETENNRKAWKVLEKFEKPFLTVFGDSDPITAGAEKIFQKKVPGCHQQSHKILKGGGHFLQEDVGEDLITAALAFYEENRGTKNG